MNSGKHKGFSIFSRLLVALLGVVVLVSGTLTAIFYIYSRRSLEKQTTETVLQQFETISYHFQYELRDSLMKELQLLSSDPVLDDYIMSSDFEREVAARALERLFLQSLKYSRSYESIAFVNQSGMESVKVSSSGRVRAYRSVAQQPLFLRIRQGQPGSIDIESPSVDRQGNVMFSAGIYKTDADIGKFGGVLVIQHSLKGFLDYLDRIKILGENPLWLFTPDGTVLKQPKDGEALLDPRPALAKGFQKNPVLVRLEGGLLVYQDLSVNPDQPLLRLAISIPNSLLLRDMQSVLRFFLLVSMVSVLVISLIAYVLAAYFSRPIVELAHAATRLAKGDLTTRVRGTATGEVRQLVDSFNRMAGDLEQTTVSKDYVDNIVSSMMDTLIVVSLDGAIMRLNDAACHLLGYEEQELIGQPISRVIGEETGGAAPGLASVLEKESVSTLEKIYLTKNGKKVPVLFSASLMRDAENVVQGVVCVAQDITERKRVEAQLKSFSEELQEINEEMKNFTYIVSHDLRAPLVNIKGFSEELGRSLREIEPCFQKHLPLLDESDKMKIGPILQQDIPEALTFIRSSVTRMDNLIAAILKLSRAGRRKLNPEPVCMRELTRSILNSFAHQIENGRVRVVAEDLPNVVADKTALEQIVGNLLENAIKYLEPGRPGEIEVTAEEYANEVVFHVRDNGRGIAKEDIPKAFEIFRRVGKQDVSGEGMGLAFVKTLVRLQGGRIWCESVPGVGTTFSFTIPQPENAV